MKYVGLQKPVETTQNFHRFKIELEPKESTSLPVTEESDTQTTVFLENFELFEFGGAEIGHWNRIMLTPSS